mmetsp:Transcript_24081/g.58536  ORF Transcript_24081/g.58536 Transcript_24081/m.58536 type:complete len:876 (+) Transcript_24081:184-2811(+)
MLRCSRTNSDDTGQALHLVVLRLVATRLLNGIHRARHGQVELGVEPSVLARGLDGLLRGAQSGVGQHEWRLAHRLGAKDTLGEGVVAQELDVEFPGHLRGHGRLVLPDPLGTLDAVRVEERLFGHVVANPEAERSLDLPDVDPWVQALPHVEQHIRPKDASLTGENVQLHLGAPGAEGKIVPVVAGSDRVTLHVGGILVGLRGENARGGQLLGVPENGVGRRADLRPRGLRILPLLRSVLRDLGGLLLAQKGGVGLQGLLQLQARAPSGLAAHLRGDGPTSEPHVGDHFRVGVRHTDAVQGCSEGQCNDLGNLGVDTLTNLASAVVDGDGPVRPVDVHKRSRPGRVHVRMTVHQRHQRDAPLAPSVLAVEFLDVLLPLRVSSVILQLVPQHISIVELHLLAPRSDGVALGEHIFLANLLHWLAQSCGNPLDDGLRDEKGLRVAKRSHGSVTRQVQLHPVAINLHVLPVVHRWDRLCHLQSQEPGEVVGAPTVAPGLHAEGGEGAVVLEAHRVGHLEGMAAAASSLLLSGFACDSDGLVQLVAGHRRRSADRHVAAVLGSEGTTCTLLADLKHGPSLHAEHSGHDSADEIRRLHRSIQRHPLPLLWHCERRVLLHGEPMLANDSSFAVDHIGAGLQCSIHISLVDHVHAAAAGQLRASLDRLLDGGHRALVLVGDLDLDKPCGLLRQTVARGHHKRQLLASGHDVTPHRHKNELLTGDEATAVGSGHILCRDDVDNSFRLQRSRSVQLGQLACGALRQNQIPAESRSSGVVAVPHFPGRQPLRRQLLRVGAPRQFLELEHPALERGRGQSADLRRIPGLDPIRCLGLLEELEKIHVRQGLAVLVLASRIVDGLVLGIGNELGVKLGVEALNRTAQG